MCWKCDDPDLTDADVHRRFRAVISEFGWAVQGVEGDARRAPWAYTVGLTEHQRPELVLTGLDPGPASFVLNEVAGHVLHADPLTVGSRFQLHGSPELEVVQVAAPDVHLLTAVGIFGADAVRAVQLVWSDDDGRWPWDRGFRSGRWQQPVLGPRSLR